MKENEITLTVLIDKELHAFLRRQKTKQKIPMGEILSRLIRRYQAEVEK